jgi:hypothetical protein
MLVRREGLVRLIALGRVIFLLAACLAAAPTTDIAGKWSAETLLGPSGAETKLPTTFTFKVEGSKLTGTVHTPRGDFEILDGKIDGESITFHAMVSVGSNRLKLLYDGRITADGIDFISKFEGGDRSDQFLATRSAS